MKKVTTKKTAKTSKKATFKTFSKKIDKNIREEFGFDESSVSKDELPFGFVSEATYRKYYNDGLTVAQATAKMVSLLIKRGFTF